MENVGQLVAKLKDNVAGLEPLPGEEDFITSPETLMRFLKARDWSVKEAEKLLRSAVEWRRKMGPLTVDCKGCHKRPAMHSIRQVGHDEMGRPVIYTSFSQCSVNKNNLEDTVTHAVYLIENAKRTMKPGVTTWVMIIDCRGISLPACNPKLGYQSSQVFSNYYPERLGLIICLNHNALFQGVWKAIKVLLHANTVAKMKLVRSSKKIAELFDNLFSEELKTWLLEEMRLNKRITQTQREFWKVPLDLQVHDPRGSPEYIRKYVDTYLAHAVNPDTHQPHPNIIDDLRGAAIQAQVPDSPVPGATASGETLSEIDDEEEEVPELADIEIAEEFQIPKDAAKINI